CGAAELVARVKEERVHIGGSGTEERPRADRAHAQRIDAPDLSGHRHRRAQERSRMERGMPNHKSKQDITASPCTDRTRPPRPSPRSAAGAYAAPRRSNPGPA